MAWEGMGGRGGELWGGEEKGAGGEAGEIAVTSTSHLLTPQPCKDNSPRRLLTRLAEIQYPSPAELIDYLRPHLPARP